MIHETVKNKIRMAMKTKAEIELSVMRGLAAAFVNEAIASGNKPDQWLTDEKALVVINRQVKQRKDSINQFRAGGREDLAIKEETELKILEKFLPTKLPMAEIKKIAAAKKTELGIIDPSKKGQLIGVVMKATAGQADGNEVRMAVEELFN